MSRRLGRETALQALFQVDVGRIPQERAVEHLVEEFAVSQRAADFARELVVGTLKHLEAIDEDIRRLAVDWNPERMANVDRNILRLAVYEMRWCTDTPNTVAINEAIELAKTFSGSESARFVNGILGQLNRELKASEA